MMHAEVIPMLTYEDGVAAMEWLCRVFGFSEKAKWLSDEGKLSHGEITMGEGLVMLANGNPEYESPVRHRKNCKQMARWYSVPYIINGVLVYVDDIRKHFEHSRKSGAVILSDLEFTEPGARYRAEDLEGQRWMFMQKA
jgi:PhnB protein